MSSALLCGAPRQRWSVNFWLISNSVNLWHQNAHGSKKLKSFLRRCKTKALRVGLKRSSRNLCGSALQDVLHVRRKNVNFVDRNGRDETGHFDQVWKLKSGLKKTGNGIVQRAQEETESLDCWRRPVIRTFHLGAIESLMKNRRKSRRD